MNVDALVVGAGPAGCAAAARLARDGATVALIHRRPPNPRRSESLPGVAARVLAHAGLGPIDDLVEGRCGGTLSAWGSGRLLATDAFASPDGPGWWIDRERFDHALRRRCVSLGVTLIAGWTSELRRAGGGWAARTASGPAVSARWVIDATGRSAAVARRLGAMRRTGPPLVAVHTRTAVPCDQPPVRIFLEAAADGWWYVGASSQRRICAVAVIDPADARRLRHREHFVTCMVALPNLGRFAGAATDWSAPQVSPAGDAWLDPVCGPGWIACGDAALAFDPLSSQGLIGALASGVAAAKAVSSGGSSAALADIATRQEDIRAIYEVRRYAAYDSERRWAQRPFWTRRNGRLQHDSVLSSSRPAIRTPRSSDSPVSPS